MAEIWKVNAAQPEPDRIARAAERIRQGQVVAIPTDTFYGLAANPFDPRAVEAVFALKGRPADTPLLLLVDSVEMAADLFWEPPPRFHALARRFWPGPLTIVSDAAPKLPAAVTARTGRIGLRLPAASIPVALIHETELPLTGTSANRSGERECSTAEDVERCFGGQLPLILDGGPSTASRPSTVIGLRADSWELLREGAIPASQITAFFEQGENETGPGGGRKRR